MGMLWRLFAPKSARRARRTGRRATHSVHYAVRVATPRPVRRLERAAHPVELAELRTEDAVAAALKGKRQAPGQPAPVGPAQGLGSDGGPFPPPSSRGPTLMRARTIAGRSSFLARMTAKTAARPTSDGGTANTM
jgi:hypothetical protein